MPATNESPPASTWWRRWQPLANHLVDLVYPHRCFGCSGWFEPPAANAGPAHLERWLCPGCIDTLPLIQSATCQVCGEPYDGDLEHAFRCWNCHGRPFAFEFAHSAYQAEGIVREVVHRFKYQGHYELRGLLTSLLAHTLESPRLAPEPLHQWLLVPVPLHRWRQMTRTYNQAWELCRELSHRTGIPAVNPLRRNRRTPPQAGLDRNRRLANLQGAFSLRSAPAPRALLRGRSILLVDDVLTTGSTCHECARILRDEGGAEKVVVITVARG